MREISAAEVSSAVERLASKSAYHLGVDELSALTRALGEEKSELGRGVLEELVKNAAIAAEGEYPICQDTGLAVVFVDWGQDAHLSGGSLQEAVDEGVRRAQKKAYLRASVLGGPLTRKNTGDNTPAIVHLRLVPGDRVRIVVAAKGGGSENMSRLEMLNPGAGADGLVEFVVRAVREAGANPCPPIVVGVGAGGNFERVAELAKRALLRPLGSANPDPELAALERRMLEAVNRTGVGPGGLGGTVTALAVHLEAAPCHIASFPAAVNIDCHAHRHGEAEL
ncbi:MAG TPA: fumarate hydratase [Planctomycetota bacterium]|nr:fumarate hydratase [Planctomycetota bacterium]